MRRYIITTLYLIFFVIELIAQEDFISPSLQVTFGNNLHTNRDILYESIKDNNDNIYLIGTTENDYTFTDIKIIKLDSDLNELWSEELSFDTSYSFDRILNSFVDSNNNLILVCMSSYDGNNRTLVVVKYNDIGEKLWEHPITSLSQPEPIGYSFYHSFIDQENDIHLAYIPENQTDKTVFFIEISSEGNKINEFLRTDLFEEYGALYIHKLTNINGIYYMVIMNNIDTEPYQEFKLLRFNEEIDEIIDVNITNQVKENIASPFYENYTTIKANDVGELVLIVPNYQRYKGYVIIYFNNDGSVKYIRETDLSKDKYIIGYSFDSSNNLIILSNNKAKDVDENLSLTLQKYNSSGDLILEISDTEKIGVYPAFENNFFSVYTENNKLVKYDYNLNKISDVQLNEIFALDFNPVNILSVNDNLFFFGTNYNSMYEGSNFLSQSNFSLKKVDDSQELNSFVFSGNGTSKVQANTIHIDSDGNYLVSAEEKMGPDNLGIGGSRGPVRKYIYKYNSNLELIEEQIVSNNNIWSEGDTRTFFNENGDRFRYAFDGDNKFTLYKNGEQQWSREIDLPGAFENVDVLKIDNLGNLFVTSSWGSNYEKMHRFTIENEYNYIDLENTIYKIVPLTNNWIFTIDNEGYIRVFSNDLKLINANPNQEYSNAYLVEKNNKILVNSHYDNTVKVFNHYGDYITEFKMAGTIDPRTSFFDENDNLVVLDEIGRTIYTYHEYAWLRGRLSRYDFIMNDYIGEITNEDSDNDGVIDFIDRCKNTPVGTLVNEFGCPAFDLSFDNFDIEIKDETCINKNNGEIIILAKEFHQYYATINGDEYPFATELTISGLQPGSYQVCIHVEDEDNFEQCFEFVIHEGKTIAARTIFKDNKISSSIFIEIEQGTPPFRVNINKNFIGEFNSDEFFIDAKEGDELRVTTNKPCEGEIVMKIKESLRAYPNPIVSNLYINIPDYNHDKVLVNIFNNQSQRVVSHEYVIIGGQIIIPFENLQSGIYYLELHLNELKTLKLIKK